MKRLQTIKDLVINHNFNSAPELGLLTDYHIKQLSFFLRVICKIDNFSIEVHTQHFPKEIVIYPKDLDGRPLKLRPKDPDWDKRLLSVMQLPDYIIKFS